MCIIFYWMFEFLVIFDFEATCDEGENPIVHSNNQEMIEFPFIIYSMKDNKVIHQEQIFVKPIWTEITPFCSELTGITKEKLEKEGILLEEALQKVLFLYIISSLMIL